LEKNFGNFEKSYSVITIVKSTRACLEGPATALASSTTCADWNCHYHHHHHHLVFGTLTAPHLMKL